MLANTAPAAAGAIWPSGFSGPALESHRALHQPLRNNALAVAKKLLFARQLQKPNKESIEMKNRILSVICLALVSASAASWASPNTAAVSSYDLERAARDARSDLVLARNYAQQDRERAAAASSAVTTPLVDLSFLAGVGTNDANPSCVSSCLAQCGGGTGSSACWDACEKEGYSSSTCASRCGTTTSAGSAACWNACGKEGYSSSTCASRCGIATSGGSAACWTACTHEGYSSATCKDRCGTN
jgi:hypothetical protein